MIKKFLAFVSVLLIFTCFTTTVMAAGTDDGKIKVTSVNGVKFFGTDINKWAVGYTDTVGEAVKFTRYNLVDFNADNLSDICDLVKLVKNKTDLNGDGTFNSGDSDVMRQLLLVLNDFYEK
jgi:hypothetical protein